MKKIIIAFIFLLGTSFIYSQSSVNNILKATQYYKKGVSLIKNKNYAQAISILDSCIKQNPKLGVAYYQRGLAKLKTNATNKANQYTNVCEDFTTAAKLGCKVPAGIKKQANCSGKK